MNWSLSSVENWFGSFFSTQFGAGFATCLILFAIIFIWQHKW